MTIIKLSDQQPIAAGRQRLVFLHPTDKTKLVKVLKSAEKLSKLRTFRSITDRLIPAARIRQIRKEYKEYQRVSANITTSGFACPLAHMFGFVTTDMGIGSLTERVVEVDGVLGKTIKNHLQSGTFTAQDVSYLNDTIKRIYANHVRASDLNAGNFVIGHRYVDGQLGPRECVLVDGFGDIHAIPIRSMSRTINRNSLDESCARLAQSTKLNLDTKTHQFSL